jgi:hypothetical protein
MPTTAPAYGQPFSQESRFPNLESVLNNRNVPPTNPYRLITEKIKEISATQAVGVSQEIRNILDGFLVNLTNQLSTFEDVIWERYRPIFRDDGVKVESIRGDSPDETEHKIPGAFVQSTSRASSTAKQSDNATSPTGPSIAKQANKPISPCGKDAKCAKPAQTKANALYLGTYVCDVCDMTPKVVRWHCNVSHTLKSPSRSLKSKRTVRLRRTAATLTFASIAFLPSRTATMPSPTPSPRYITLVWLTG